VADNGVLGPSVGYIDLLDHHLTTKLTKERDGGRDYHPLRPSSAGKCTRELSYEFDEYKNKTNYNKEAMNPDTHRLLSLGHSVEWNILRMFEEVELFEVRYKQQVVSFFKIDETRWIEGSVDAVIWSPQHKAVIDIKSKKNNFSSWSSSQWDEHSEKYGKMKTVTRLTDRAFWINDLDAFLEELDDPFLAANFYQLNMYANSQFLLERMVDHGAVVQYNKNDSRLRELRFRPSKSVYDKTRAKFELVSSNGNSGGTPEAVRRDFALGSIKCAFCSFKRSCWPEADALKEYFKTWPKKQWPDKTAELGQVGQELEALFVRYHEKENAEKEKTRLESLIVLIMNEEKLEKIQLHDNSIYEMRALQKGLVIRRAKR
jgi:hypothetical protein